MSKGKRVRYVLEDAAPFGLHGEGLSIKVITRKSEIPVTVEIEGMSRKRLLEFRTAIDEELARREASWRKQELMLRDSHEATETQPATEPRNAGLVA